MNDDDGREFERELAANAAALRSIDADEAAYAAMRARVMRRVAANARWSRNLVYVAGIAAAALLFFAIRAMGPLRAIEMRIPPPYHIAAPEMRAPLAQVAHRPRAAHRRTLLAAENATAAAADRDQAADGRSERGDYMVAR